MAFVEDPKFWVAAAFITFLILVGKKIGGFVVGALDSRAARIRRELEEATRLREEAQALLQSYQERQKTVLAEAEAMLANAQKEANRIAETAQGDLESLVAKRAEQVMQRLSQMEAQALNELRDSTVDIAISAARSVIKEHLDKGQAAELFQLALKDAERKLH